MFFQRKTGNTMRKSIRMLVVNICVLKLFLFNAPSSFSKPKYVNAYFYDFTPKSCRVSLTGYGSSSCTHGVISVAADSKDSVNLHLISGLGQWQLVIADGDSFMPKVDVVLIRSSENIATKKPAPTFYYNSDDGGIIEGSCTPIPIARSTSGRCTVRLKGAKLLDVSFTTDSLEPSNTVQQVYN